MATFFLLFIILFTFKVTAENFIPLCKNNDRGNYTTGGTYHNYLKIAFIYLTYNSKVDYGFYNTNYGQNNDKVNLIGICRGDINHEDCRKCLVTSKSYLTQACPNKKEAIGWLDEQKCMLRYSDRSILGLNEMWPVVSRCNLNNATLAEQFNIVVNKLLNDLKNKARNGGDTQRKYAVGTLPGPRSDQTIYGLVQCTPDLSVSQCDDCLHESIVEVPIYCTNKLGARIYRASCYLRFETYQFYLL